MTTSPKTGLSDVTLEGAPYGARKEAARQTALGTVGPVGYVEPLSDGRTVFVGAINDGAAFLLHFTNGEKTTGLTLTAEALAAVVKLHKIITEPAAVKLADGELIRMIWSITMPDDLAQSGQE